MDDQQQQQDEWVTIPKAYYEQLLQAQEMHDRHLARKRKVAATARERRAAAQQAEAQQ